jgi:hypothetical protein
MRARGTNVTQIDCLLTLRFEDKRKVSPSVPATYNSPQPGNDVVTIFDQTNTTSQGFNVVNGIGRLKRGFTTGRILPFALARDVPRIREREHHLTTSVMMRRATDVIEM